MQSNNVIQLFTAVKPISTELSDVFFNMEHTCGESVDPVDVMEENAEMLISLLLSVGAQDVPSIEDLLNDFEARA